MGEEDFNSLDNLLDFDGTFRAEESPPLPLRPVNRWKALEEMVEAEKNPLVLFLLTPLQDLEEQVKYCSWLIWRYAAFEAKLESLIAEEKGKLDEFVDLNVKARCELIDPGTNKYYTNALATRLAKIEQEPLVRAGNIRMLERKLRLVKAYLKALVDKSNKLPGKQGTFNANLRLEQGI